MNFSQYVEAERLSRTTVLSNYDSSCKICTGPIARGSLIVYDRTMKLAIHTGDCFKHYISDRLVAKHDSDPSSVEPWNAEALKEATAFLEANKLAREGSDFKVAKSTPFLKNKFAQSCWVCGKRVPEMTGRLFMVNAEQSSNYNGKKGWLVEHLSCGSEAVKNKPETGSISDMPAFITKVKGMTGLEDKIDFTWCDKGYRLGDEILRDEKYVALEYLMVDRPPGKPEEVVVCGFTVKPLNLDSKQ
jgi:hypothetical protein